MLLGASFHHLHINNSFTAPSVQFFFSVISEVGKFTYKVYTTHVRSLNHKDANFFAKAQTFYGKYLPEMIMPKHFYKAINMIFHYQNYKKKSRKFELPAYSGARYPKVPAILVSMEPFPSGASRTSPKSETLALISSPRRMLEGFKSL